MFSGREAAVCPVLDREWFGRLRECLCVLRVVERFSLNPCFGGDLDTCDQPFSVSVDFDKYPAERLLWVRLGGGRSFVCLWV